MSDAIPTRRALAQAPVDELFLDRWSPRSFTGEPLTNAELDTLFEAARWAPSCSNDQPWLFVCATADDPDFDVFCRLLDDGNRRWATKAGALVFVFAARSFSRRDRPNRWAQFDTGAAWMSLTLQARLLGLYTHGMAGIDFDQAPAELGVAPETHALICAVAIGRRGAPDALPDDLREREKPSGRLPHSDFVRRGAGGGR